VNDLLIRSDGGRRRHEQLCGMHTERIESGRSVYRRYITPWRIPCRHQPYTPLSVSSMLIINAAALQMADSDVHNLVNTIPSTLSTLKADTALVLCVSLTTMSSSPLGACRGCDERDKATGWSHCTIYPCYIASFGLAIVCDASHADYNDARLHHLLQSGCDGNSETQKATEPLLILVCNKHLYLYLYLCTALQRLHSIIPTPTTHRHRHRHKHLHLAHHNNPYHIATHEPRCPLLCTVRRASRDPS
jgi:hypothetical protein